jgi:glycosyltransferase involved in cell wall biosynthesis
VPVHRGSLAEAVARSRPDLLHVHWLCIGQEALALAQQAGLPATVRGHGFEFTRERGAELLQHPAVRRLYVFPHFAPLLPASDKVMPLPVAFSPDRFYPPARKDPRLVVRTSLAKDTKDPATFLHTARLCPGHRFVLAVCTPTGRPTAADEVRALAADLHSPAEVRVDLSNEEAAELVRSAGIFLHTYSYQEPFGMPISIAEALATGAHVLARQGEGIAGYLGPCGQLYDNAEHAAALIAETAQWSPERWQAVQLAAVERAYGSFADSVVLESMLKDWQALVSVPAPPRAAAA